MPSFVLTSGTEKFSTTTLAFSTRRRNTSRVSGLDCFFHRNTRNPGIEWRAVQPPVDLIELYRDLNRKLTHGKHCIDVERRDICGIRSPRIILLDGRDRPLRGPKGYPDAVELARILVEDQRLSDEVYLPHRPSGTSDGLSMRPGTASLRISCLPSFWRRKPRRQYSSGDSARFRPKPQAEAALASSGSGGTGSVVAETSGSGLTIDLLFDSAAMAAPASFRAGIEQAASILAATISDKITVNINIDYSGTGGGAAAGPDNGQYESYSTIRTDLVNDASPGDTTFNALPTGRRSRANRSVAVWNAQLKLSGFSANSTTTDDGSATFATDINSNLLVGVALHELTHAMGRVPYGPQPDIFDLYRFTSPGTRAVYEAAPPRPPIFRWMAATLKSPTWTEFDPSDFLNSGVQGANDPFNEYYSGGTLQSLTTADKEMLDALGFHLTTAVATTINTDTNSVGSTSLVQFFGNYYLENASSGLGPELKDGGVAVVPGAGQFSGWNAIGAVATSSGYDVAWRDGNTDTYTVWTVDSHGNFVSSTGRSVTARSSAFEGYETTFNQDLNGDGFIGGAVTTKIEANGSTSLVEAANNYYLDPVGGAASGRSLKPAAFPSSRVSAQMSA